MLPAAVICGVGMYRFYSEFHPCWAASGFQGTQEPKVAIHHY